VVSDATLFADDPTAGQPTFTVRELTSRISATLTQALGTDLWVEGELRNLRKSAAGHVYFDLIEPTEGGRQPVATMSVVLFDKVRVVVNQMLTAVGGANSMKMEDGMMVRLRGTVDFYAPQGRTQIRMTGIDPNFTLGRLVADRDQLLAMLTAEGLLDRNAQLPFPLLPLRVALVTSAGSAAAEDFLAELRLTDAAWQVQLIDTRVQGFAAVDGLTTAIGQAAEHGDVIAVVRGGGARTDLVAFDHESVARAIAKSSKPVITGVGHEIDHTVADDVAARSYKTPTAAAVSLVERLNQFEQTLVSQSQSMSHITARVLSRHDGRLTTTSQRVGHQVKTTLRLAEEHLSRRTTQLPATSIRSLDLAKARIEATVSQIGEQTKQRVLNSGRHLDIAATTVRLLDPQHLLARGWSITRNSDGVVVRSLTTVEVGDTLSTQTSHGVLTSIVQDKDPK
jgi:exodeoxyribonuclease VII large subunit